MIETRIPLRWADTDALGHIYHAVHVELIDEARGLWLDGAARARARRCGTTR